MYISCCVLSTFKIKENIATRLLVLLFCQVSLLVFFDWLNIAIKLVGLHINRSETIL